MTTSNHNSEREINDLPSKIFFRQLFIHEPNLTTAFQNEDGSYTTHSKQSYCEQDITDHLSGYKTIGLPVAENGLCKFAVIDIDIKKEFYSSPDFKIEHYLPQIQDQIKTFNQHAAAFGLDEFLYWEYSGFKGAHGWFFFEEPVPVADAYKLIHDLFHSHIVPPTSKAIACDYYPKSLTASTWLIRAPWGVNRKSGHRSSWILPFPASLPGLNRISSQKLSGVVGPLGTIALQCKSVRNLLLKAKQEQHLTHGERYALASMYLHLDEDGKKYLVNNFISKCSDYDARYTDDQLKQIKRRQYKPITCSKLQEDGICEKSCPLVGKNKSPIVFYYRSLGNFKMIESIDTQPEKYSESWIVSRFQIDNPHTVYAVKEDFFYEYREGRYVKLVDREFDSLVNTHMLKYLGADQVTNLRIDQVRNRLKKISEMQFSGQWNPEMFKINLKNGVFDVKTRTFLPQSPEYRFTRQLAFEFKPMEECPRFEIFLRQILEPSDGPDKTVAWQEKIDFMLNWMCYSFFNDYTYQKILNLIGLEGRNGKGRLAHVWEALLGSENISHVDLQTLAQSGFALINLRGKFLNITTDLRITDNLDMTELKRLTGGDVISANVKNKPFVEFMNTARLVAMSNDVPRLGEIRLATLERFQFVEFEKSFTGADVDTTLDRVLGEELPGIFNLLMQRFERVYSDGGGFAIFEPDAVKNTMRKFMSDLHNVLEFADECIVRDEDCAIDKANLFAYYYNWWAENKGYKSTRVSSQKFKATMIGGGFKIQKSARFSNREIIKGAKLTVKVASVKEYIL